MADEANRKEGIERLSTGTCLAILDDRRQRKGTSWIWRFFTHGRNKSCTSKRQEGTVIKFFFTVFNVEQLIGS